MSRLLPLFPLQLVAFPGNAVPLHIFEERYREMVGKAEADGTEFGIVLAKDGGIVNAGCTVLVRSILKRYSDGRFDVLTEGHRRFSILSLNQDEAWLRGEVEYFEDDDDTAASPELRTRALQAWKDIRRARGEQTEARGEQAEESVPDIHHPLLSFQLALAVEDTDFQNMILRSRSETERLQSLIDVASSYIVRTGYKAKMQRLAPLNGHGQNGHLSNGAGHTK